MKLTLADRWIISRLQSTEQAVIEAVRNYRFDLAAQAIYEFTWNEYCDWYLELSKTVLTAQDAEALFMRGTRRTLVRVLETLLRLAHPIMPFITEEIWQRVAPLAGRQGATIMLQPYPAPRPEKIDQAALDEMNWVQSFILGVRTIRSTMNITPGKPLPVLLQNGSAQDRGYLDANRAYLKGLARLDSIVWLTEKDHAPQAATALVGQMKLLVPMAGLIDKQAELARLVKDMEKLRKELERGEAKIANQDYVSRAPRDVVDKERRRVEEIRLSLGKLREQQERVQAM